MLLSSARSPSLPGFLSNEFTNKMDVTDDQLEILSYLTSESSDTSSRESSPYSVLTSSATPYLSDDTELPDGMMFHHKTALIEPPAQRVIDPRLLSAPYSTTINESSKYEPPPPPPPSPEARKASLITLDDPDFEVDDISGLDDDEYFPPEETKRKRALPSKHCATPTKKRRTMSPSPNVTIPNSKRARNPSSSTDEVEHELKRISNIKGTAKKKAPGRRNKDLSCKLCSKRCTRQSDLLRHVATHDPLSVAVCRGISEEEALEHNIDSRHLRTCSINNELRIGGCGLHCSRKDALQRHVKLRSSRCILLKGGQLIGSSC